MRRSKLIAFWTCLILQQRRQEVSVGGTKQNFDSPVELMITGENGKSFPQLWIKNLPQVYSVLIRFDPDPTTQQLWQLKQI